MKPLYKNILIEKLTREQLGKVILPDSVQDDWFRGKVIAVGSDISKIPIKANDPRFDIDNFTSEPIIKVDDIVIFPPPPPHLGEYPVIGDDGYIIISENMVLALED